MFVNTTAWHVSALVAILIMIFSNCAHTEAYMAVIPSDPENPNKCIFRGYTLKPGLNPGNSPCQQLTCNDDGSIMVEGCGKLRIENCNRGERMSNEAYPECCKLKYKCKQADGTPFYIEKDVSDNALAKAENTA